MAEDPICLKPLPTRLQRFLEQADANNDGKVTIKEFQRSDLPGQLKGFYLSTAALLADRPTPPTKAMANATFDTLESHLQLGLKQPMALKILPNKPGKARVTLSDALATRDDDVVAEWFRRLNVSKPNNRDMEVVFRPNCRPQEAGVEPKKDKAKPVEANVKND